MMRVLLLSALDESSFRRILNHYEKIIIPVGASPKNPLTSYLEFRKNLIYRLHYVSEITNQKQIITTPFLGNPEKSYILMHPMCKIKQDKFPRNFLDYISNMDFIHKGKHLIDLVREGSNFVWFKKDQEVIPYILMPVYKDTSLGKPVITKKGNIVEIAYNASGDYCLKIESLEGKKINLIIVENKEGNEQELERVLLE
jgi:hypothetical protein